MSVVKINAVTVPRSSRPGSRSDSAAGPAPSRRPRLRVVRAAAPLEGTDQYLVYTRWSSEEAYQAWQSGQDFDRAHDGGGDTLAPAAAPSHHLWSYEVLESAGPTPGRRTSYERRLL